MKLQDYFPEDLTIAGLENLYYEAGQDTYFINSPCIIAEGQIITRGYSYLLIGSPNGFTAELSCVILLDVFCQNGYINLVVLDRQTQNASTISHSIYSKDNECIWRLIEINYFIKSVISEYR